MGKIKVGIVNYLNTAPLIYGLENSDISDKIELVPDYPANLADDLKRGEIDLGLVPVAVIPQLNDWHLVGEHCIGSDGEVASVCLFSEIPLEQCTRVLLDYQSRTSVALAKLLLKNYWKFNIEMVDASAGYEEHITGSTAALVIGDRSLRQRTISTYHYDLGEAWKAYTGLPFVFAAWVSNKKLDDQFIRDFDAANAIGLKELDKVILQHPFTAFDLHEYYTKYISYHLDEKKKAGLKKFLSMSDEWI